MHYLKCILCSDRLGLGLDFDSLLDVELMILGSSLAEGRWFVSGIGKKLRQYRLCNTSLST